MAISLSTIGTSIVASIVDGNFAKLESYLREQILDGDIKASQVTRLLMKRYENGKLAGATTQSLPILDEGNGELQNSQAIYDLNFRHVRASADADAKVQESQTMELLGRPGPSLYWQVQEDGISYTVPTANMPNRYPSDVCYSNWLSVPNTSVRVYVPYPCVARIDASAYFLANISAVASWITGKTATQSDNVTSWNTGFATEGDQIAMQFALVADTNPVLYADEFSNSNPHILNPANGSTASYVNFKFVNKKKVHTPLWARESITGEVVLQGGRWYNFSLKFKGAGTQGYMNTASPPAFVDGIYEYDVALPNWAGGNFQKMAHIPPHEILWISSGLSVEFFYGYRAIQTNTASIPNIT